MKKLSLRGHFACKKVFKSNDALKTTIPLKIEIM